MSQHSDDRPQGEPSDIDPESESKDVTSPHPQDLHPAIDPREAGGTAREDDRRAAPAVDIDARKDASLHQTTPDVIELAEHADGTSENQLSGSQISGDEQSESNEMPASHEIEATPLELQADPTTEREPQGDTRDDRIGPPGAFNPEDASASGDDTRGPRDNEATGPTPTVTMKPKVPSRFSAAASRLGLGKLLETSEDSGGRDGEAATPRSNRSSSRRAAGIRSFLDPRLHVFSTVPHQLVLAAGLVLILICLLANSGGLALIVLSAMVPILIVITLTQHDVFEKESNLLVAAVGAGGAIVGIVLSLLSAWIHSSQWFDTGVLNFGAAGFGGRFADSAGSAPFVVWSMVGLVIPAVATAGIAGIPIALRRWPQFRNEVMDGMILAGASAAGFTIGASLVYWWPMIAAPGPQTNVSDWTLSIIGVAILRPAVITMCGAMIGAGIWRYMVTPAASVIVLPAVGGVAGYLLLTFGSVQLQAAGNWPEFIWTALLLAAVFVLHRRVLDGAVVTDRRALGKDQGRLVCPSCHKVTPTGAFCARCGKPLPRHDGVAEDQVGDAVAPDHVHRAG